MSPRILCILGMHRSGTSCLMSILEQAGVYAGSVTERNVGNPHGNRENIDVWILHEALLKANGGDWLNPPDEVVWSDLDRAIRDEIVRRHFPTSSLWAFKDPRLVFTLHGWLEAFPQIELVGTFRHPLAVAESLHARDQIPPEQATRAWCKYNERLLRVYEDRGPFPVICFDLDEAEYTKRVNALLRGLGLGPSEGAFNSSFRHHLSTDTSTLSSDCRALYQRLMTIAGEWGKR